MRLEDIFSALIKALSPGGSPPAVDPPRPPQGPEFPSADQVFAALQSDDEAKRLLWIMNGYGSLEQARLAADVKRERIRADAKVRGYWARAALQLALAVDGVSWAVVAGIVRSGRHSAAPTSLVFVAIGVLCSISLVFMIGLTRLRPRRRKSRAGQASAGGGEKAA